MNNHHRKYVFKIFLRPATLLKKRLYSGVPGEVRGVRTQTPPNFKCPFCECKIPFLVHYSILKS